MNYADDSLTPLTDEWMNEISRRSAEYDDGKVQTIPWEQVRREARLRAGLPPNDSVACEPTA
jgi:putative addiction module component (TIGR02574 family)